MVAQDKETLIDMKSYTHIKYKKGYKYQLATDYKVFIPIKPLDTFFAAGGLISLNKEGLLIIRKGYAWDGPSGPAADTKNFMRPSLIHDALYESMRDGLLHRSRRREVDMLLRENCREDGMSKIRSSWVYWAVNNWAARSSTPEGGRKVLTAP